MFRRALREARTDDRGMSVAEVVVASFILFFALTAVLGLIGATTRTSISAKQRTAMTNAVSSYIEYVHSLPYARMELTSVDPSGGIEPTVVKTDGPFTITLTNTITNGPHNTRELSVSAVCSAENYPEMHTTAFAAIRDRLESANDLGQPHSGGPIIDYGILAPAENSIVYENNVSGGGALYVDASAQSTSGVIYTMEFRVGDQRLKDNYTVEAGEAYWTPGTATANQSIRWDTRQVRSTGTRAVKDGWRIIRILATDDLGRQTFKDRRYFVDNDAPSNPGTITCVPRTDVTTLITWPKSMDGTDPAYRYEIQAWRERTDSSWDYLGPQTLTQPAHTQPTSSFRRYWVRVRAYSPRGLSSSWVTCGYPWVSRPLLTGESTCTITGSGPSRASTTEVRLVIPSPGFPATNVQYALYRGVSESTLALYSTSITPPSFSETVGKALGVHGEPDPYYYQLRITLTPTGWPDYSSSAPQTVVSDIVGPTPVAPGSGSLTQIW